MLNDSSSITASKVIDVPIIRRKLWSYTRKSFFLFFSELNQIDLTIRGFMTKRCFLEEGEDL